MSRSDIITWLIYLSPILLIQFGLAVYALLDLRRRVTVHGPKALWAVLLVITTFALPTGILVSALYLAWGRHAEA